MRVLKRMFKPKIDFEAVSLVKSLQRIRVFPRELKIKGYQLN